MVRIVYVELVCNICNARCLWCHLNYKPSLRMKKGMMDFSEYKKFISINRGFPMLVRLLLNGESILHPWFPEIVEYTLDNGVELGTFTTNLSIPNLSEDVLGAIARHPRVIVNFGGGTPWSHLVNTGTRLDVVLRNLSRLMEVKKMMNPKLRVVAKMVLNKNNIGEENKFTELVKGVNKVKFTRATFHATDDMEDTTDFLSHNINHDGFFKKHKVEHRDRVRVKPTRTSCESGYIVVRFDGAIQCCCNVWYHDGVIGNAFETPLDEIVESDAWRKCQEQVKSLSYVDRCKDC